MKGVKIVKGSNLRLASAEECAECLKEGGMLLLRPDSGGGGLREKDALERMNDFAKDRGDSESGGLRKMNRGKIGHPYWYDGSLIEEAAIIRYVCGVSYRACERCVNAALGEENAPHYTTLCRRINKLDVSIADGALVVKDDRGILRFVPDSAGITPGTRSEWMRTAREVRLGLIKLGLAIGAKEGRILAVSVTGERAEER